MDNLFTGYGSRRTTGGFRGFQGFMGFSGFSGRLAIFQRKVTCITTPTPQDLEMVPSRLYILLICTTSPHFFKSLYINQ